MLIINELINLNLESTSKEDAIKEMAKLAMDAGRVRDLETYVDAVLRREEEFSTGIGFGVAIPHGKSDAVIEPFLAFAKTKELEWASMDQAPVKMIFLIGVPSSAAGTEHLKLLANISRKLMKKEFRRALEDTNNKEGIIKLLEDL